MDYTRYAEEGCLNILKEICEAITGRLELKIVIKPEVGAMVISQTYPHGEAFLHTTQQLATYCEVEIDGYHGCGCVQGSEPERAYYAAVIDAVMWNVHPVLSDIAPLIKILEDDISAKWKNQRKELYA
jgi:alpha-D-ribose 1-methylphosphonate 5-triphosphate synthase subunit PhnG